MAKQSCPRCGGELKLVSGFRRCSKCEYVINTQNLNIDWSLRTPEGFKKAKGSDDQHKPDRTHNPKRRNPLRFTDD